MHRTLIAILTTALLALPAASATWYFAQSYEPSTEYDTELWMFQDPPPVTEQRVYFAAESHYLFALGPYISPNVGLLHSRIEVSNGEHHSAMLGVWRDCNGDGYVGAAETAVREYPASLLLSEEACPATTGPANGWTAGAHNYNGWVSELIPIGRDGLIAVDRRMYLDDDVRVWGDYHRPDEAPFHRPCPLSPQPRGTYQSTGGAINFVDCRADIIGLMNIAFAETGDPLNLRFSDTDDARSGPLGQIQTFGPEDSEQRTLTVWDCSSRTRVGDELNKTPLGPLAPAAVHNLEFAEAEPKLERTDDPLRGVAATYNHTFEGVMVAGGTGRNCDTSDDFGHDFYSTTCPTFVYCVGEDDFNGINPKDKREAHFNMRFDSGQRGIQSAILGPRDPIFGTGGIAADGGLRWGGGGTWSVGSYWLTKPGFGTIRTHLQDPSNATVEPAGGLYFTWYAYVPENLTARGFKLPGGEGVYASWHCGSNTSGVHNGFNCNKALWYLNPTGTPSCPTCAAELERHELALPGDPYNLRDVDCYDGGIGALGIGVQPAYYGPRPCS
ncbi:MAG TPA: hypothetical protein VFH78_01260 [Candidatus Thermoplasmatota archaeon]|nr:hypothetical protein [Candidatus Thermoplasmatota archaeon]